MQRRVAVRNDDQSRHGAIGASRTASMRVGVTIIPPTGGFASNGSLWRGELVESPASQGWPTGRGEETGSHFNPSSRGPGDLTRYYSLTLRSSRLAPCSKACSSQHGRLPCPVQVWAGLAGLRKRITLALILPVVLLCGL